MTNTSGVRFANTFLDIRHQSRAVLDEMMIDKETGYLYYKRPNGDIVDIFNNVIPDIAVAALENNLESVLQLAKEYADQAVTDINTNGHVKLVRYSYNIIAEEDQTHFDIPLSTFDKDRDLLLFTTNTVMPDEGFEIIDNQLVFDEGLDDGTVVRLIILKNVPVGDEGSIDAVILEDGTVTREKLSEGLLERIEDPRLEGNTIIISRDEPVNQAVGSSWFEIID